jgi:hypothetical protein
MNPVSAEPSTIRFALWVLPILL